MRGYMALAWNNLWKLNSHELKSKAILWRSEQAIHRIERPSRLDKARRLGYKAKQGIIMVRARVGRGGMRKQRPVAGRRPKHLGVVHIKQGVSMRHVAERRVLKRFPNMESLGSYYLHKDGRFLWYEVILADPNHPSIAADKEFRQRLGVSRKN
ncbi:50S ribosomal protein L15e [Nitrososphaera sp. AFS]|jgi:large subunit ribosomal protein L15e|uniref:50S ribosomal protein L15e n=1 Tax=Nitrososphaera sp. AFS TaxID=2301191 RepID=UPI0013924686|nr:50S ribosomal protein L15e [Nitrososphaera sp. AFS]NAL77056.1 50S ribosomal protein L15e [Nitrososphaera sp. AFS]